MLRSTPVRIILGLVLLAGLLAIAYSLKTRRDAFVDLPDEGVLAPYIDQQTTQFEFTQIKRGKPVFRVSASRSTLTDTGIHELSDIYLIRYDQEGETTDEIVGKTATYDLNKQRIELHDDVTIWVAGGTTIYATDVAADLKSEIIRIADRFTFERDSLRGEGKNLRYRIEYRELRVSAGIHVISEDSTFRGTAGARNAFYSLADGRFELFGNARLTSDGLALKSKKVEFGFDENRQINSISAFSQAVLTLAETRRFEGEQIKIFFSEEGDSRLEIVGDSNGGPFRLARFRDRSSEMDYTLEAREIDGFLHSAEPADGAKPEAGTVSAAGTDSIVGTDANGFRLRRLVAAGEVSIASPGRGIEDGDCDLLTAVFLDSGELEHLEMEGRVKLIRRNGSEGNRIEEVIRCRRLLLNMDSGERLQNAEATGNVDLEMSGSGIFRQLQARRYCRLSYNPEGELERIEAADDCLLQSFEGESRSTIRAPFIESEFENQKILSVSAEGGVDLDVSTGASRRHTRSEQFRMEYRDGEMDRATQTGNFQLKERTPDGYLELLAEYATYDTRSGEVMATGENRPLLRNRTVATGDSNGTNPAQAAKAGEAGETSTRADRFIIGGDNKTIRAEGNVESAAETDDGAVVITADSMRVDPESQWVVYSGSAQMVLNENLIEAGMIELNTGTGEMKASGNVHSVLTQPSGEDENARRFDVRSKSLILAQNREVARYEGDVRLTSEELSVQAPRLDLVFQPGDPELLEKVVATGGVVIVEGGRTWRGERAEYLVEEERVTVNRIP